MKGVAAFQDFIMGDMVRLIAAFEPDEFNSIRLQDEFTPDDLYDALLIGTGRLPWSACTVRDSRQRQIEELAREYNRRGCKLRGMTAQDIRNAAEDEYQARTLQDGSSPMLTERSDVDTRANVMFSVDYDEQTGRFFLEDNMSNSVWLPLTTHPAGWVLKVLNGITYAKEGHNMQEARAMFKALWEEQLPGQPLPHSFRGDQPAAAGRPPSPASSEASFTMSPSPPSTQRSRSPALRRGPVSGPAATPPSSSPAGGSLAPHRSRSPPPARPPVGRVTFAGHLASSTEERPAAVPPPHAPPPRAVPQQPVPQPRSEAKPAAVPQAVPQPRAEATPATQKVPVVVASPIEIPAESDLPEFNVGFTAEGLPFVAPLDVAGNPDPTHVFARALRRESSGGCDDWTVGHLPSKFVSHSRMFVGSQSGVVKSIFIRKLIARESVRPLHAPEPEQRLLPPESESEAEPEDKDDEATQVGIEAQETDIDMVTVALEESETLAVHAAVEAAKEQAERDLQAKLQSQKVQMELEHKAELEQKLLELQQTQKLLEQQQQQQQQGAAAPASTPATAATAAVTEESSRSSQEPKGAGNDAQQMPPPGDSPPRKRERQRLMQRRMQSSRCRTLQQWVQRSKLQLHRRLRLAEASHLPQTQPRPKQLQ